ncbi:hypothetical protein HYX11_01125 [Candidatus Woesearchaeota archaeon]|nr:hypothetical protein [Candidatus Woesearchaeota archaeon]
MLAEISEHLRKKLKVFFLTDELIFNNKVVPIIQENFEEIKSGDKNGDNTIAFVDGGQAEILSGGNLCLSFIRVFAQVMKGKEKVSSRKYEFYVLVMASYKKGDIWYEGKIFPILGEKLVEEKDLVVCSGDSSIRQGNERAQISIVATMARRFAELKIASLVSADYVLLDGTLTATYVNEEKYLGLLSGIGAGALAKSCTLFTTGGNNPMVLLRKLSPFQGCWSYCIEGNFYFVKLHGQAKHVFRFEGNKKLFSLLVQNSADALFLGYPYGLILADKLARVSNAEKNALMATILLRKENREFTDYLNTINAHDILDRMG